MLPLLGNFNKDLSAYFEVYWAKVRPLLLPYLHKTKLIVTAKEDHVGTNYDVGDYGRVRHPLVGNEKYRGPHRVRAWGESLVLFMFLDKPRAPVVVEVPKATNNVVLAYDSRIGFNIEILIGFPHQRSAFEKYGREILVQISPLAWDGHERKPLHLD